MKILKFGGSSVATAERIQNIANIVKPRIDAGEKLVLVFSALGGVTDMLIEMSTLASKGKEKYIALYHQFTDRHTKAMHQIFNGVPHDHIYDKLNENHNTLKDLLKGIYLIREASPRTMDYVLSFGERNANLIITEALRISNIDATYVDARHIIVTNKDFGNAKVNFKITDSKIVEYFEGIPTKVAVVTGFIGADLGGLTTTLGRGGSDYTAAILASALHAESLEIWTDVDGVLTSDPRKVKNAFTVPKMSYAEAMEMSHFGAKVIYPPTIQPALKKNIPIYIKNTFNPSFIGTRIDTETDHHFNSVIKGISALNDIALITIQGSGMMGAPGMSGRFFSALGSEKINVILITQASSEHSMSIAVKEIESAKALQILKETFQKEIDEGQIEKLKIENDLCIMAIVGEKMKNVPGIAGKLFKSLGKNGINIAAIAQGSSELNISFVIKKQDETKALNAIHDAFFLSETKKIHLYLVGIGLIGKTLLRQIFDHTNLLKTQNGLEIILCGIANSKKMLLHKDGIDLENCLNKLEELGQQSDMSLYTDIMIKHNQSNSVFIDASAHKLIPDQYKKILSASITVATPNKIAASSEYINYIDLKQTAKSNNVQFLYETNVGAGLPVISTIKNLVDSGDKVLKIEAVLSGSLNYIFSAFDGNHPFSHHVLLAKELGYTEPDPREDLSGQDVARKITILAREAGFPIEKEDVLIHPILSQKSMISTTVEEFFNLLLIEDEALEQQRKVAYTQCSKLRFVATATADKVEIGLQPIDAQSPFYRLEGSDNMIVLTTERYKQRPLVIQGPGAGAEVTAAGVFAEIVSTFNRGVKE